jgi:uncharacterized protein YbjQ (UPF0145 family)
MGRLTCPICGKTQGALVQSAYAFTGTNRHEICFECGQLLDKIRVAEDFEAVAEQRDILSKRVSQMEDGDLKDYLMQYVKPENVARPKDIDLAIQDEKREKIEQEKKLAKEIEENKNRIKITTTNSFDGYFVKDYIDVVYGEVVVPNGILGALTSGTFFTIEALETARTAAISHLKTKAATLGANAIIGIDIDIQDLNGRGMMVSANGTAVQIEPIDQIR